MPLFDWAIGTHPVGLTLGYIAAHGAGDEAAAAIAREIFRAGIEPDEDDARRLERTRWLEANRALRTFPCGVVPDPVHAAMDPGRAGPAGAPRSPLLPSEPGWAAPDRPVTTPPPAEPQTLTPLRAMNVMAAVLPADVVFLRESEDDDEVDEVGRLPREAIREVDVVDVEGDHVPEPVRESIEPPELVFAVLRWSNAGAPDEDRFAFRSPWLAWKTARRLLEARRG